MSKIGIIINPYSKKILRMQDDPGAFYKKISSGLADIRLTHNEDEIIKAANDFKDQSIQYLAISGGDGSIHLVISKFISVYKDSKLPEILILRDGSMNNVARSYNMKGTGPELLRKLIGKIENIEKPDICYRDTIKVNDMYCFMFGLGFVSDFINEFNKGGEKSPLKAIKIMLLAAIDLFRFKEKKFFRQTDLIIKVDGKELPLKKYLAVYAATIANLAVSFIPTPRAYEKENTYHMIATAMKPLQLFLRINKIRTGKRIVHPAHYDNIASRMEIIHPGEFTYQMDGDIYAAKDKLLVTTGPRIGFVSV